MIHMPHRSVTRFFIPMIDVLTLLFCIYLLMPVVGPSTEGESEGDRQARLEREKQLEAELARKGPAAAQVPAELLAEIERLRKEKIEVLKNRLAVRVLEVDPENGQLLYRDPDKVLLRSQDDALRLIERDRQRLGVSNKELYYVTLYPRDPRSAYPTREQRLQYDRWFSGVALAYDIPGGGPGKER